MPNKRSVGHSIRSIYFVDYLRDRTGFGETILERTIREDWYQPNGFSAPSPDAVSAYFKGARPIPYDPTQTNSPPWLYAAEQQFPGCSRAFFHPLWTFLYGRLHSSAKFIRQKTKVPREWIDESLAKGDTATAKEWEQENALIDKTVPKKPISIPQTELQSARVVMLLMPKPIQHELFTISDGDMTYLRSFHPIEDEIEAISNEITFDSLTALLMLVVEASEIGDQVRLKAAKSAAKKHLKILNTDKAFRRVREQVERKIIYRILEKAVLTVSPADRYLYFPESWWLYEHLLRISNLPESPSSKSSPD